MEGLPLPVQPYLLEVFPPPAISEDEEERIEMALAARAAEIFDDTGPYVVCAILDPAAR